MADHSDDRPADAREHLRERVRTHVETLAEAGLSPNRTVALGGSVMQGWLIDDPFVRSTSRRWLLLSDGDVWSEAAYVATPWSAENGAAYGWLSASTSALDAVLDLSADEIASGGLLANAPPSGSPHRVADRRGAPERRSGDDRRSASGGRTDLERRMSDRRSEAERRHDA